MSEHNPRLVSARTLASRYGLPAWWLLREAGAARLPHLRAGFVVVFDAELVERRLLDLAGGACPGEVKREGERTDAR